MPGVMDGESDDVEEDNLAYVDMCACVTEIESFTS